MDKYAHSDHTLDDAVAIPRPTGLTASIEAPQVRRSSALSIEAAIRPPPDTALPIRTHCKIHLVTLIQPEPARGWSGPGLGQYRRVYSLCAKARDR